MYNTLRLYLVALALVFTSTSNGQQPLRDPSGLGIGGRETPRVASAAPAAGRALGPLRVSASNPRYFVDGNGREVLLVGSHTWGNFVDAGQGDPPPEFNFRKFLQFVADHNHNFFRLWVSEQTRWVIVNQNSNYYFHPHPYTRTGPGFALDGKPRFDLSKLNEDYFVRLKQRVDAAAELNIYVAVMLFNGWSISKEKGNFRGRNVWHGHPFHRANNINGLDGDVNGDDSGEEIHTLVNPGITEAQVLYVREVVRTLADAENVLYEISNESNVDSVDWQYRMIDVIRDEEERLGVSHPVGMTALFPKGTDEPLMNSEADWVSVGGLLKSPVPADGSKVIIADTDHICGLCGTRAWAWKSFLSGENPIFMDPYDGALCGAACPGTTLFDPRWMEVRRALGNIRALSERLDLGSLVPMPQLSSTGYSLAASGDQPGELITYIETGGTATLNLERFDGPLTAEWINPSTGQTWSREDIRGGSRQALTAPFTGDAVLYVYERP